MQTIHSFPFTATDITYREKPTAEKNTKIFPTTAHNHIHTVHRHLYEKNTTHFSKYTMNVDWPRFNYTQSSFERMYIVCLVIFVLFLIAAIHARLKTSIHSIVYVWKEMNETPKSRRKLNFAQNFRKSYGVTCDI